MSPYRNPRYTKENRRSGVFHAAAAETDNIGAKNVHTLTTQGDLSADGHTLAQLKVCNALAGLADDSLLAGDLAHEEMQQTFMISAESAIDTVLEMEPKMSEGSNDELTLEFQKDGAGVKGDVQLRIQVV